MILGLADAGNQVTNSTTIKIRNIPEKKRLLCDDLWFECASLPVETGVIVLFQSVPQVRVSLEFSSDLSYVVNQNVFIQFIFYLYTYVW